ncbi:MAG: kinase, partial [Chloroflexi bacterium]|nr:kinase [Chloroflexota bacterium]
MSRADLPPLIQALLRPEAYPHSTGKVLLVQTHISYVLLAGDFVYKIKKPLDMGFLDYSTLGKRQYYCRQEVLLNSRLCSDTYLGVVPIRESVDGVHIGGKGKIVEYAVHMKRLPEERMMHRLLEAGKVTPAMVRRVADRVAQFHAEVETSKRIAEYGGWAIRYAWDENSEQWAPYIGDTITAEQDRILKAFGEAFFARNRVLLQKRIKDRRIRDCHSDLRSDSVSLVDGGVCIMDCVEFNRRIRWVDVIRDVGFLAMDLEYRGRSDLSGAFVRRYSKVSGDAEVGELIDFYKAYNACVRGKVDGFRLSQPEVPAAEKRAARKAARRYFELACEYAESLRP